MTEEIIRFGYFVLSDEERKSIMEVCDSNRITEHVKIAEFQKSWAKYVGTDYSIAVNSGTSGLMLGLSALKYLANDPKRKKVITSPLTFIATANAIQLAGLESVFGDINKDTFDIKASEIEKILDENDPEEFLALLPVHLMGYPAEMDKINEIAKKNNLYVFEDAAQAHGTEFLGKKVGAWGDLSNYSFYVAHNVQVGEFGAVNTSNLEIKNLLKKLKAHGRLCICDTCERMEGNCPELKKYTGEDDFDPRYTHDQIGFNFKANEFMGAIAIERVKKADEINIIRRKNVKYLNEKLEKHSDRLTLPVYSEDVSYLAYPLVVNNNDRKQIRQSLEDEGIETRILFGCIPSQQPSYANLKDQYQGKLPNADYVGANGFFIGCHQGLGKKQLDRIVKTFDKIL